MLTVLEKEKIYDTNKGRKVCRYVVFQKKNNGTIHETYCGLTKKDSSYIKAYTLEVQHLQTRFEYYLNALMTARERLESYQQIAPKISKTMEAKNHEEFIEHECPICFNHTTIPCTQLLVFCPNCDYQFTNNIALEIGEGSL